MCDIVSSDGEVSHLLMDIQQSVTCVIVTLVLNMLSWWWYTTKVTWTSYCKEDVILHIHVHIFIGDMSSMMTCCHSIHISSDSNGIQSINQREISKCEQQVEKNRLRDECVMRMDRVKWDTRGNAIGVPFTFLCYMLCTVSLHAFTGSVSLSRDVFTCDILLRIVHDRTQDMYMTVWLIQCDTFTCGWDLDRRWKWYMWPYDDMCWRISNMTCCWHEYTDVDCMTCIIFWHVYPYVISYTWHNITGSSILSNTQ